jgi:hypothetical protein
MNPLRKEVPMSTIGKWVVAIIAIPLAIMLVPLLMIAMTGIFIAL